MAVTNAMYLFEVVVQNVKSLVESRHLVIRSEFADIFSLDLKDPKQMHIVIPDPPPLPPEAPGKKGKKKKPPKKKKGKKGKKGKEEPPPPEPVIQSGQSVLFTSTAEFLIQNMKKFPLEMSLWSKEDNLVYIGSNSIPWDPKFFEYLEKIYNCQEPPPVTLNEEYNVFEEGTAKLMAKISIQVKLTYLTDRVTTCFRTLSEDPVVRKVLYTGINSKTTSYICTLKTTDEVFEENCNKIENSFIKDKPKQPNKIAYADYKNAPGANLPFFNEGDYCCMGNADKPPDSIYKAPETCPDVDFIVDYVRKIITSCNDNMRMLTPRPTIRPRVKATDIDKLCYCRETEWPPGEFAERFKKEAQREPCPMCIDAGKRHEGIRPTTFDIANIRGPCGRPDCKIAREMRAYIENMLEEDNQEFKISDLVGPCGSKVCTLAEKMQQFLRHEGPFSQMATEEGLSTQCACLRTMQEALTKRESCASICSKDCEQASSSDESNRCQGKTCPFNGKERVYDVYYFTVEHDFHNVTTGPSSSHSSDQRFKYCSNSCPSAKSSERTTCSKSTCPSPLLDKKPSKTGSEDSKCQGPVCSANRPFPPSPADSKVMINFNDIRNLCCVKSCDIAERVKDFIVEGTMNKKRKTQEKEDPCYCDCICTFKFSSKTTYCAVCGGYECLGDDMKDQPEYAKPHPCPVYHKLYDKRYIKTPNPWPEDEEIKKSPEKESPSSKSLKLGQDRNVPSTRSVRSFSDKKETKKAKKEDKKKKAKPEKKKVGKYTANAVAEPSPLVEKKPATPPVRYPYPPVPKNMGWNWTAEDIPGMKPRPKWKPGAANKILVRRYRTIREGIDIIAKKKRALMQRKKKIEMKPTLIVKKQGGEYTVQMEVFKKYSKERMLFQYPYDEKPPIIYTIGKSAEEKLKRQKKKERRERRETRRKSRLLQSTFRDKCQEICLKAYNQAMGLLPLPNPNSPDCPCITHDPPHSSPMIDSCSCSEESYISSEDTDDDEWTIEFTPPAARWDQKAKHPPNLAENESQYNYLDYKVKLLDKSGNQVPRFFKGPDGKEECSDLGGFWGPGHVWQEINKDGYIGPDNRWVPMNFTGPDGMFYSAEDGTFTDASGQLFKIGIDGYIDKNGKWAYYSRRRGSNNTYPTKSESPKTETSPKQDSHSPHEAKGDAAAAAHKGIKTEKKSPSPDAHRSPPKTTSHGRTGKNPLVMNVAMSYNNRLPQMKIFAEHRDTRRDRTRHKDWKKIAKYREIMKGLQMYEEFYEMRPPKKTNRASNTPSVRACPVTTGGMMKHNTLTMNAVHSANKVCPVNTGGMMKQNTSTMSAVRSANKVCADTAGKVMNAVRSANKVCPVNTGGMRKHNTFTMKAVHSPTQTDSISSYNFC